MLLVCGMPVMHTCCTCFSRTSDYIPIYLPLLSALAYLLVINHPSPVSLTSPLLLTLPFVCSVFAIGLTVAHE